MERVAITYGTFDLFHIGHLNILNRLKQNADKLVVGVSTDEFNAIKGKKTVVPYSDRVEIVRNISSVDEVFPEEHWEQKVEDIRKYRVTTFGMGHDWAGKFDFLKDHCEVVYLPRTDAVSSTDFKKLLKVLNRTHIQELKQALDLITGIVATFED